MGNPGWFCKKLFPKNQRNCWNGNVDVTFTLNRGIEMNVFKNRRWIWVVSIPILALAGFLLWAFTPNSALPESSLALQSNGLVEVNSEKWFEFIPTGEDFQVGLILYPGGRVDPRAYAPVARSIAERGFVVVVIPAPLNLAVFAPDAAQEVIDAYQEDILWAVGGHSLGGAMAARFASRHAGVVDGLVLWAAYPASSDALRASSLRVVSIYGTRDGLASVRQIEESRPLLPTDTRWVPIEGGNHAQFGSYGRQAGDNAATIDPESQQAQIIDATVQLLEDLEAAR
jgi:hypothetical protein